MCKRHTKEEIIKLSNEVHGNKYDYSLVEYVNNWTKIKIICPEHGIFEQKPIGHINKKRGCNKCNGGVKLDKDEFISKSINIHKDKYDYSLVEYINSHTPVEIICKIHGVFKQRPNSHLNGHGCSKCAYNIKNNNEFISTANKIHYNRYDYSLVEYKTNKTKVNIICDKHGIFSQVSGDHLRGNGCPLCKESKGELLIRYFIEKNNILYVPQKTFKDCKHIRVLPFDFYLPEFNICIEYDGQHHYFPLEIYGGEKQFKLTKIRDNIKTNYCEENRIKLIRIKYDTNINEDYLKLLIGL